MNLRGSPLRVLAVLAVACALASCSSKKAPLPKADGGISALFSVDSIALKTLQNESVRKAAPLGVFVSEYLSDASTKMLAQGGIDAVGVQSMIIQSQQTVTDPDFELLQVFQDALQVDVSDLLNRSEDRQLTLDTYTNALTNVATRANDRYKELSSVLAQLKDSVRSLTIDKNNADRAVQTALKNKDYTTASDAQKTLTDKQTALADATLKEQQTDDIVTQLDALLNLYGQKILAIQQNRELLISGIKVVDVPGIDQLNVIQRTKTSGSSYYSPNQSFDTLFSSSAAQ